MCGIFGYYNFRISRERREVLEILFTGLKRLEYRGYDSSGLSFDADPTVSAAALERVPSADGAAHLTANGKAAAGCAPLLGCTPVVIKVEGKIDNLVKLAYAEVAARGINLEQQLDNHAGIAHTRWATHGVPSAVNSHPQVSDPAHGFVVVHNGIITNFKALKDFLVRPQHPWLACRPSGLALSLAHAQAVRLDVLLQLRVSAVSYQPTCRHACGLLTGVPIFTIALCGLRRSSRAPSLCRTQTPRSSPSCASTFTATCRSRCR